MMMYSNAKWKKCEIMSNNNDCTRNMLVSNVASKLTLELDGYKQKFQQWRNEYKDKSVS